jgi:hypothetical protein
MKDPLKTKIDEHLGYLEELLKAGLHLKHDTGKVVVALAIADVGKYTKSLSEDQRDYLNAAKRALEDGVKWKCPISQ